MRKRGERRWFDHGSLREDFAVSYPAIGQKLGGRDHTTVIHSCEKIRNELKGSSDLEEEISQIRMLLK